MTHSTQSWLSAGADRLHRLLAPSCSDVHTEKSSACSWVVHLAIILSNKKTVMAQLCPVPVSCLSEPQPQAGLNMCLSSPVPRGCCKGAHCCVDTPGRAWSSSDTARKERGKARFQYKTHQAG